VSNRTFEPKLRTVFSQVFGIPVDKLPQAIDIDTIAGWDSLVHLSLIEQLEHEFDVTLSQAEVVSMLSESDIVRVLAKKLQK
jgi:acyl carrier protein